MEPLSAVILATNFIAIADQAYRAINFVRRAYDDPRTDGLYVRLVTERARYAEWKRRMGIENMNDLPLLIHKVPPAARESMQMILEPIGKYLDKSELLIEKYAIEKPGQFEGKVGWRDKLKRFEFFRHGEKELSELLDTLKHCNDGLLTIAPPPPGYFVSLSSNDPLLESSQPTQQSRNREHSQFGNTGFQSQGTTWHTANIVSRQEQESGDNQDFHPVIEFLYSVSLDVLRTASVQYLNYETVIEKLVYRLSLWGSGMFQGPITIDQVLNQQSDSVNLLRNNIAQTLAEIAVLLEHMLLALSEPPDSALTLRLKSMFSIPEISQLPLYHEPAEYNLDSENEQSSSLEQYTQGLSDLIECLFCNLPTIEIVFKTVLARQKQNPALDERKMLLLKSESDISLSKMRSGPTKELLKVDLELIAATRESLKNTKYAEYLEQQGNTFNAQQLYQELGEESALVKYWTSKLAEENDGMTEETQAAVTCNLARIAHAFAAGYEGLPSKTKAAESAVIQDLIRRCRPKTLDDETDDEKDEETNEEAEPPINNGKTLSAALDVLKSSTVELRRLAGSKTPGMSYQEDFSLSEKSKEREAIKMGNMKSDDISNQWDEFNGLTLTT